MLTDVNSHLPHMHKFRGPSFLDWFCEAQSVFLALHHLQTSTLLPGVASILKRWNACFYSNMCPPDVQSVVPLNAQISCVASSWLLQLLLRLVWSRPCSHTSSVPASTVARLQTRWRWICTSSSACSLQLWVVAAISTAYLWRVCALRLGGIETKT